MTRRILAIAILAPLLASIACRLPSTYVYLYGYPTAAASSSSAPAPTHHLLGGTIIGGPGSPVSPVDNNGNLMGNAVNPMVFTPAPAALTSLNTTGAVPKIGLTLCDAGASCTLCQLIVGNESNTPANCGLFAVAAIPTSWTSTAPSQVFPLPAGGTPQAYSEMDWGNGCITSAAGWTVACSTAGPGDGGAGQLAWSAVTANIDITGWGCVGSGCIP